MSKLTASLLVTAVMATSGFALAADQPPKASPAPKTTTAKTTAASKSSAPKSSGNVKTAPPQPPMTPEQKAMMEAVAKAGTPGAQHKMLAGTSGNYTVTVKSWETPDGPPMEEKAKAKRSMTMDGRILVEEYTGTMMGAPFMGHGMTGYDNVSGKFWATWNDSMSTGIAVSEGTCDAKNTCTFNGSYSDPIKNGTVKMRMTSRWPTPRTEIFEMYGPGKDGNEMKMMEMTYMKDNPPAPAAK